MWKYFHHITLTLIHLFILQTVLNRSYHEIVWTAHYLQIRSNTNLRVLVFIAEKILKILARFLAR